MRVQKQIFTTLIIVLLCFILSCCSCTTHEDQVPLHNLVDDHEEAFGYDSQAYPSYLSMVEDGSFMGLRDQRDHRHHISISNLESCFSMVDDTAIWDVKRVNVLDFGAKSHETEDDTEAFEKAWKVACASKGAAVLEMPQNNYLLKPIRFSGPCKSVMLKVQIEGSIEASDDESDYGKDSRHWLQFDSVQNLVLEGGGTINGNGHKWWQNSCKTNKTLPCKGAPTAVTFYNCKNLIVRNLKVQDAQQMHLSFQKCVNVQAYNLFVTAPETSPNTDGIHVTNTQNIQISNSVIGTGDDCISIVSGSQNVKATDITCGPGHGISIGSLGSRNSEAHVSGVTINRAKLSGTKNGVRIKTWQGGSGSASNIEFENIEMNNVANPIIIDQNYCDQHKPCKDQLSAVEVKNVVYKNIAGTSASDVAIRFECSKSFPCRGVVLQDINLKLSEGNDVHEAIAICNNIANLTEMGLVSPRCSYNNANIVLNYYAHLFTN
ncbi:hypothetical protein FNV43_RR16474 [Rhamnella rubrinervis]|uniref:endo-polygalacturonase n=1 Tax=Rhamnella rubrinervis TaxID=2594499 RepID=A0A8K0GYW4_9ROSA|nr:hypothetical protein FNV43_RR16474 [Rhamnella rubrinervis]